MDGGDWRRADADGWVLFPALDDGTYEVSVECRSIETFPKEPLVVARDVDGVVWSVSRGLAIEGVVVDADGHPLEGVNVRANPRDQAPDDDAPGGV